MLTSRPLYLSGFCAFLTACAAPTPPRPLAGHLHASSRQLPAPEQHIPPLVNQLSGEKQPERYSVSVQNVPARDLLLALIRDAGLNADLPAELSGKVSLHAVDQTLPQLLERIARLLDMRIELNGNDLLVAPDLPFIRHYQVDYVNLSRSVNGSVSANTQIANASNSAGNAGASSPPPGSGNLSNTRIDNNARNQFWESLERNIKDILRETDKILPDGSSETLIEQNNTQSATGSPLLTLTPGQKLARNVATVMQSTNSSSQSSGNSLVRRNTFREAASVIVNAESGVVAVRATQRQHERIGEFIARVEKAARRQVLIEATIVEVSLRDGYEQGIDWSSLIAGGSFQLINRLGNTVNLSYDRSNNPRALISFLNSFGSAKVLSSPRLVVLNNQTALLKVVENYVYFSVKADTTATANVGTSTVYTTTPQTVSVGLVMSVTPQIGRDNIITLNIRPTVTSVGKEVPDPNPDLKKAGIENLVPVIRTREIESILRIENGQTAILGGLMEDRVDYRTQRVPIAGSIPLAGELLTNRNNFASKSELVVFLRPSLNNENMLGANAGAPHGLLPDENFFLPPEHAQPLLPFAGKQP